jgi:hypothetical protein
VAVVELDLWVCGVLEVGGGKVMRGRRERSFEVWDVIASFATALVAPAVVAVVGVLLDFGGGLGIEELRAED